MVTVIGAGAIGGYLAAMLTEAGHKVTVCVRTRFDALTIEGSNGRRSIPVEVVTDPNSVDKAQWILLATKVQDTYSAKPWLDRLVGPSSTVLIAQNGIEQVERTRLLAESATIIPSIIYISAERLKPGYILHHGASHMIVPAGENGAAVQALFAGSELEIVESRNFLTASWRKLLANIAANALTALTMRRMDVFTEQPIVALARCLLSEAVDVGQAEGAQLCARDVDDVLSMYANASPEGGSSMLYDRLSGRSLEHEHLTGALLRAAEKHGIEVPLNQAIFALLDAIDRAPRHAHGE